jgi:predicted aspartyl protease
VEGHHDKKSNGPRAEPSRVPVFKRTGALSHARKPSKEASNKKQKTGKYCPLQKTSGNDAGECKVILAPIARMRGTGKSQTTAARSNNNKKIEKQRESLMNEMLAQFKDTVAETVHESDDSSSDATDFNIDNFNTDSDDSFDAYTLSQLHSTSTGSTSTKDKNFAPVVVAKIQSHPQQPKVQWIRVLLDSGASGTIINGTYTKKINTQRVSKTEWTTKSGTFVTEKECKIHFSLPEFHENKIIEWTVHVDDTEQNFKYDMIIGRDLLEALGISFDFAKTYYHMG